MASKLSLFFNDFRMIFISTLLEAMPFLLIGAFVSSLIHLFVSPEKIKKILPENIILRILLVTFTGVVFPICECAVIPIVKKLLEKGVSLFTAVYFMFIVPIINPVSLLSTFYAFPQNKMIVLYRGGAGIVIGLISAFLVSKIVRNPMIEEKKDDFSCGCSTETCGSTDIHNHSKKRRITNFGIFSDILEHTGEEFFQAGFFLTVGALISAFVQILFPMNFIDFLGKNDLISLFVMEITGYLLSICSHGDAFIGSGFKNIFPLISVLGFLIVSPLIDVKNTLILLGNFKRKFAVTVVSVVFTVTFLFFGFISLLM